MFTLKDFCSSKKWLPPVGLDLMIIRVTGKKILPARMHSSRIRTARTNSHLGGSPDPTLEQTPLGIGTPGTRHPRDQAPPPPGPGIPLGPGTHSPSTRHHTGPGTPLVDRHTPVNLLPCPKLRLRAVKIRRILQIMLHHKVVCTKA